jgi:selenocysteine lyase/cysteine desulfurase
VLCTTHDHYVHHEAIRLAVEKSGASWRRVPLYDDPRPHRSTMVVENLKRAIAPKTRVIGITWVHSSSGVKLPIKALTQAVVRRQQGRGEKDRILVSSTRCTASATRKRSSRSSVSTSQRRARTSGSSRPAARHPVCTGEKLGTAPPDDPDVLRCRAVCRMGRPARAERAEERRVDLARRFKAYEHQWAMPEAFEFHQSIGRKRIADRIAALNTQCKAGLAKIPKVKVLTPMDPALSAGLIAFEMEGQSASDTMHKLYAHKVVASTSPYRSRRRGSRRVSSTMSARSKRH